MSTWLVTGGAGYIGSHVIRALQAAGEAHGRVHREELRALTTREAIGIIQDELGVELDAARVG